VSQAAEAIRHFEESASRHGLTGRARVCCEGANCTLTGSRTGVREWCSALRSYRSPAFADTEFKLTDGLPEGQRFPKLHVFKVDELVNYGLAGSKAPPIAKTGTHLEPEDYHAKMEKEENTVVIDVRNRYESAIGRFDPGTAELIDPMMRKSTEFPVWLDRPETREKLRGKQVLMYCTGGVRCERASALLRQKMETEDEYKDLGIQGVYQLQGGIDKYFRKFPNGGCWVGKNYTFDKRFAHAPPGLEEAQQDGEGKGKMVTSENLKKKLIPLSKCEACGKAWDKYRGKRRCPTCGVPSLICKECFEADKNGIKKLGKEIRCELCVKERITKKYQLKERMEREMSEYEIRKFGSTGNKKKQHTHITEGRIKGGTDTSDSLPSPNPDNVTRLFVSNLCIKSTTEETIVSTLLGATHVQWISDRKTGKFRGCAFVEMDTPGSASVAAGQSGSIMVAGRLLRAKLSPPGSKDVWPSPGATVL